MKLRGLGYVGMMAPDPAGWLTFAVDVLGLMPARGIGSDSSVYLKMDDWQWRIAVHPGERPGLQYMGFELAHERALDEAIDEVTATGTVITRGTADEASARGVQGLAWCLDPAGVRVELFFGAAVDHGFVSPVGAEFLTGDLGLGHVLLFVDDMQANLAFYRDVIGLDRSDFFSAGPGASLHFLRCTPRHHSVGLITVGPFNGVHHLMLEMTSLDGVGAALDRATAAGLPITSSLGRHVNDRMVSFYMRTPGGFDVEVGYDGVLCGDDWVDHEVHGRDPWGHHGIDMKVLEEFSRRPGA